MEISVVLTYFVISTRNFSRKIKSDSLTSFDHTTCLTIVGSVGLVWSTRLNLTKVFRILQPIKIYLSKPSSRYYIKYIQII